MCIKKIISIVTLFIVFCSAAYAEDISGEWVGVNYASEVKEPSKVILHFTQTGNTITGDYWVATGVAGQGKGKMTSTNTFHMDWTNTTSSCPGSYSNDYVINGNQITWTFTGKDCLGPEKGHGYAYKSVNLKKKVPASKK